MTDTLSFSLIIPSKTLISCNVSCVELPGAEGNFTVYPGHAAIMTTLRPGIVQAQVSSGSQAGKKEEAIIVFDGFVEVSSDSVCVLAERTFPKDGFDVQVIVDEINRLTQKRDGAENAHLRQKLEHSVLDLRDFQSILPRGEVH